MVFKNRFSSRCGIVIALTFTSMLSAAPRLALTQAAFTVAVVPGQNGTAQSVDASNLGDSVLNLSASSSVSWLTATIGAQHACSLKGNCIPVQIALQTSSLSKGTYTGTVTVSDPKAVDSPQFVTVTVKVGGAVPDKLEYFVPPSGSASSSFTTAAPVTANVSNNTPWLSIATAGMGSFQFGASVPYQVTATAQTGMASGDYNGSIAISGSSFAPDNKSVPVVLHVTTQPILQTSTLLPFEIAQGANKQTQPMAVLNAGQGTLTVSGVTASAASGTWLSAQTIAGGISITADPSGLSPNSYQGTVTITSNAVNSSATVPVVLNVLAQAPPIASAGGLIANDTLGVGESMAQGDIVALYGHQFTFGDAVNATSLPLPVTLGDTQVLVNGQPVPVYYVGASQIDFEIPIDAATGDGTVQVVRSGQQGNLIYVNIKDRVPHFLLFNGPYAIMTTPDGTLTGIPTHPVKAGDVVVIYTIGLGPTTPVVPSGTASPGSPLAVIDVNATQACFGVPTPFSPIPCVTPQFVGLSPGFVGLYQVNLAIPDGLSSGNVPFSFSVNGTGSDVVQLAVQ